MNVSVTIPTASLAHLRAYVQHHNLTTPLPEQERLDWPRRCREYLEDIAEERETSPEAVARELGLLPPRMPFPPYEQIVAYVTSWGWVRNKAPRWHEYVHPDLVDITIELPFPEVYEIQKLAFSRLFMEIDEAMGHPAGTMARALGC